jgi:hypothetical protein
VSAEVKESYLLPKEGRRRTNKIQPLLVLSIAVAVTSVVLYAFRSDPQTWVASFCFAILWLILLVVALVKFKKRGLWVLLGAPFVLFFPFAVLSMLWACGHNRFACP